METQAHQPGRVAVVDLLRGAALLGIFSVNIWFFASPWLATGQPDPDYSTADWLAYGAVTVLFATKSYLLFSFLFGYSFVLQEQAAERAGVAFAPMMRRRLLGLVLMGLLHGLLLFPGDILLPYGLLGFALLAMRRVEPRRAVRRAALMTLGIGGLLVFIGAVGLLADPGASVADPAAAAQRAAQYGGSAADVLAVNVQDYLATLASVLFVQGLPALAAMLVGLAVARTGALTDPAARQRLWRRLVPAGALVGAAGAVLLAFTSVSVSVAAQFLGFGVAVLTAPLLSTCYVLLLARWQSHAPQRAVILAIAAAGRLALTNYLAQSVVMALLFTGYGLGLVGHVSALQTVAIVVIVYAAQVLLSRWWGRRHRYGPAEWVLRRWSRGQAAKP